MPANTGDTKDVGLILGPGRSLGIRNGKPLQYFYLENSMDKGAWQTTVYWASLVAQLVKNPPAMQETPV